MSNHYSDSINAARNSYLITTNLRVDIFLFFLNLTTESNARKRIMLIHPFKYNFNANIIMNKEQKVPSTVICFLHDLMFEKMFFL